MGVGSSDCATASIAYKTSTEYKEKREEEYDAAAKRAAANAAPQLHLDLNITTPPEPPMPQRHRFTSVNF
jgi:hypothetical protein